MKRRHAFLVVALSGVFIAQPSHSEPSETPPPLAPVLPDGKIELAGKPVVSNDPVVVFQKAFWKRPGTTDRILNAERREWIGEHGVTRWQWFLEVTPSPELIRYLREENAFGLNLIPAADIPQDAPEWFIRDTTATSILANAGGMRLIFTEGDAKLFATSSGGGLRPGTPEAAKPAKSSGGFRMPASPPVPVK
jgi:hypothetical protein